MDILLSVLVTVSAGIILLFIEHRTSWIQKHLNKPEGEIQESELGSLQRQEFTTLAAIAVSKWGSPEFKRLDNVSLVINPGELVAIVGVSGSGRSTLLDILRGAILPDSGSVLINGSDLYRKSQNSQQRFGYVAGSGLRFDFRKKIFEYGSNKTAYRIINSYLSTFRGVTVEKAIKIVASLRLPSTMPDETVQARIYSSLEAVAMTHKRSKFLKELNPGQLVRFRLALELLIEPKIIFLDEAISGFSRDLGLSRWTFNETTAKPFYTS